ncbi:hypothetical protein [Chelativorans salis]|uniref:Uncharacterized protein n=1 Tax=Chelativorans salis TaxID=2978478 RepID=A0ABT2LUB3_9HYPH|nr:hypothetical protein [Chelativorans sp. EGI FJ00035]MCT7377971.1 hypothetical protein [Chelativorans sp. EGI FJ00035]
MRTGSAPFWATFNAASSFAQLKSYLERTEPYDDIRAMIFPHGTESVGLPSLDDWRAVLQKARGQAGFVGINDRAYPHHFSALARYHMDISDIPDRHPLPPPVPLKEFEQFCGRCDQDYTVRLVGL